MTQRSGTVLIIVSALSALLVSLSLTFLARVRSDVEESDLQLQLAQSRVTLVAACQYIQEASRIGWDTSTGTEHNEAFGWIDVRDGSMGPRVNSTGATPAPNGSKPADPGGVGDAHFPVGQPLRFDLFVPEVPPYAISQRATYNPVSTSAPDSGRGYLRYPDPQPVNALNRWAGNTANPGAGVSAADYLAWTTGKVSTSGHLIPRQQTLGRTWFRIIREPSGAIFTITCGAGGSRGYRTWKEVDEGGDRDLFNNDDTLFYSLRSTELRLWYRVEWSPAATVIDMNFLREHEEHSFRVSTPTHVGGNPDNGYSGQQMAPTMGGTIQWIQRLRQEPEVW